MEKEEKGTEKTAEICELGAAKGESDIFCLSIIGEIEGHGVLDSSRKTTKYEHLLPLLFSLEEDESVKGILILLNTLGGDVEAGLALAEVIASMKTPSVSLVLGGGHSIGVPLATAARRSFIVPSATMTVHPVRTGGLVLAVPQSFDYLARMQDRIVRFVTAHSRVKEEEFRRMMMATETLANDIGTLLEGEDAVSCGLIDEVGGLSEAIAALRTMTKRDLP
ncbi:MAG: ATP-dependent Clp protease proteolytic subunit [Clostridia bacterium]|nr:ATP-dependent Clp protease proteolytic subunit [Clostridia bacterium]